MILNSVSADLICGKVSVKLKNGKVKSKLLTQTISGSECPKGFSLIFDTSSVVPAAQSPQGPAGGSLVGSYPNPVLGTGVVDTENFSVLPGVKVSNNSSVTIPNSTSTILSFDTETYDTAGMFDSLANTQIAIPIDGVYLVQGSISWVGNLTGIRESSIFINAVGNVAISGPSAATGVKQQPTFVGRLSAGDLITLKVFQNSGGNLNVGTSNGVGPTLSAQWLGP